MGVWWIFSAQWSSAELLALFVGVGVFVGLFCVFCFFVACLLLVSCDVWPLGVCGVGCGVVLVVASCEGHMVDALASRADEGRWSLRKAPGR